MAQGRLLSGSVRTFSNRKLDYAAKNGSAKMTALPFRKNDTYYGGLFQVTGTVAVAGPPDTPVSRKVRLFNRASGRLVREMWSAPNGNYSFDYVLRGPWMVLAHDHTDTYNAVVADNRLGEPM